MILSIVMVAAAETDNIFNCNHPIAQNMVLPLDWVIHSSYTYLFNSMASLICMRTLFYSFLFASSFTAQKIYLIFHVFFLYDLHLRVDVFKMQLIISWVCSTIKIDNVFMLWSVKSFQFPADELSILFIFTCGFLVGIWLVVLKHPFWHQKWSIFIAIFHGWYIFLYLPYPDPDFSKIWRVHIRILVT